MYSTCGEIANKEKASSLDRHVVLLWLSSPAKSSKIYDMVRSIVDLKITLKARISWV
jgi:hypothetical protein